MQPIDNGRSFHIGVCIALLALAIVGCGNQERSGYLVEGEITWNGEPISEGNIAFIPTDETLLQDGVHFTNGKFSLRARAGKKRVEIFATRVIVPAEPGKHGDEREQYLPPRYNQASTLTVEVEPHNKNHVVFKLD